MVKAKTKPFVHEQIKAKSSDKDKLNKKNISKDTITINPKIHRCAIE